MVYMEEVISLASKWHDVIFSFVRTHDVLRSFYEHTTKNQDVGYEGVSVNMLFPPTISILINQTS